METMIERTLRRAARQRVEIEPLPTLDLVEREHIERVLAATDGNVTHAAEVLGIHLSTLRRKLTLYRRLDQQAQQHAAGK